MENKTLVSICLGAILAFATPLALADNVESKPEQMYKALTKLKDKGYVIVKKIEFDDSNGTFMAKVVNAEGKNLKLQVDPKTGKIAKEKGDITGFTAIEIAKNVQDAGYTNIYEINTEVLGNEFEVKAIDNKGEKVTLKVDVETGKVIK